MIVMKFGGASTSSSEGMKRLAGIVHQHLERHPLVVVSAMGDTTDRLIHVASVASRGHAYQVWKELKELQEYHMDSAARVVSPAAMSRLEETIRRTFLDLHITLMSVCEDGRELTPALYDEVVSRGELLSSRIVTCVLETAGVPAIWLDPRDVIVTDDRHRDASPLLWETYARVRRTVPIVGRDRVIVTGGFVGATESGTTTTLGRGGSDLTATLIAAGIAADEVQLWKEVDGILSCDPRVAPGLLVKHVSYAEASAMAAAGAKVLHPLAMQPVIRQRIPVIVKNTQKPRDCGTRIDANGAKSNTAKSIAVKNDLTVLTIRAGSASAATTLLESLTDLCRRRQAPAEFAATAGDLVYIGVRDTNRFLDLVLDLGDELDGCVEAHIRSKFTVITIVGDGVTGTNEAERITGLASMFEAETIRADGAGNAVHVLAPQASLQTLVTALHRELFSAFDPAVFEHVAPVAASAGRKSGSREQFVRKVEIIRAPGRLSTSEARG